jgi:hypothetical protein
VAQPTNILSAFNLFVSRKQAMDDETMKVVHAPLSEYFRIRWWLTYTLFVVALLGCLYRNNFLTLLVVLLLIPYLDAQWSP